MEPEYDDSSSDESDEESSSSSSGSSSEESAEEERRSKKKRNSKKKRSKKKKKNKSKSKSSRSKKKRKQKNKKKKKSQSDDDYYDDSEVESHKQSTLPTEPIVRESSSLPNVPSGHTGDEISGPIGRSDPESGPIGRSDPESGPLGREGVPTVTPPQAVFQPLSFPQFIRRRDEGQVLRSLLPFQIFIPCTFEIRFFWPICKASLMSSLSGYEHAMRTHTHCGMIHVVRALSPRPTAPVFAGAATPRTYL
jgi:hypothetical protein